MWDKAPYPGLRPFRKDERDIFFGRDGNVDEIVRRLAQSRFMAVLGASGSGKSSLVRTGVFHALELGLLRDLDDKGNIRVHAKWRFVDFKPGGDPIGNLARALAGDGAADNEISMLRSMLQRGPRSVVEWFRGRHLESGANLLLLVDQFEELFRYNNYETREHAQAFVKLLIESAKQLEVPIYVVLTMRSEYLGACALIDGLAEAINDGQYLTPRLTRDQCREAIEEPATVCNVEIEPELVNRLLNDLSSFAPFDDNDSQDGKIDDPKAGFNQLDRIARRADQLPLMQHVLNRLWTLSRARKDPNPTLKLKDYLDAGALRGALSAHADEILADLNKANGPGITDIVEAVFRALVSGNSADNAVRWPTPVNTLVKIAGGDEAPVLAVIEAFRSPECNFLTLNEGSIIDISHESLIRQWERLRGWVQKEAELAAWWRRLVEAAQRHAAGRGEWLTGRDLAISLQFRKEAKALDIWAARYGGDYQATIDYLTKSRSAEREAKRWKYAIAGVVILFLGGLAFLGFRDFNNREREQAMRSQQREYAEKALANEISRIAENQEAGDLTRAGARLANLLRQFIVPATGAFQPPPAHEKALEEVVIRQAQETSSLSDSIEPFRPIDDVPADYLSTYGTLESGYFAVAAADSLHAILSRTNDWKTWSKPVRIEFRSAPGVGPLLNLGKPVGIALFNKGRGLAIAFPEKLLMVRLTDRGAFEWQVRDIAPDKDLIDQNASGTGSGRMVACRDDGSRFILKTASRRFLFIDAVSSKDKWWSSSDRVAEGGYLPTVKWQSVFKGVALGSWTVDPQVDGGMFAAVNDVGRVLYANCASLDVDRDNRLPTQFDGAIYDIEFTRPGELGVLSRDLRLIYMSLPSRNQQSEPDGKQAVSKSEILFATTLPEGFQYFRMGTGRAVWLREGTSIFHRWNAETKNAEVTGRVTGDLSNPDINRGRAPLLLTFGRRGPIAYSNTPQPKLSLQAGAHAVLLRTEKSSEVRLQRRIDSDHELTTGMLRDVGLAPRRGTTPTEAMRCHALVSHIAMGVNLDNAIVQQGYGDIWKECRDKGPVSTEIMKSLIDALVLESIQTTSDRTTEVIRLAAEAAASGNPHALLMMGQILRVDDRAAGDVIVELAIRRGAPLTPPSKMGSGSVEEELRKIELEEWRRDIARKRAASPFASDHEVLAIVHAQSGDWNAAAIEAAIAVRLYEVIGHRESAERASRKLRLFASRAAIADAERIWKQAWLFKPTLPDPASSTESRSRLDAVQIVKAYREIAKDLRTRPTDQAAVLQELIVVADFLRTLSDPQLNVDALKEAWGGLIGEVYDEIVEIGLGAPPDEKASIARIVARLGYALTDTAGRNQGKDAPIVALELFDASNGSTHGHLNWLAEALTTTGDIYRDSPDMRPRIRKLQLRFLLPDDDDLKDTGRDRRELVEEAERFVDQVAKDPEAGPNMLAANAGVKLWLAVLSPNQRSTMLLEASLAFDAARAAGADSLELRISHVEALKRQANSIGDMTVAELNSRVGIRALMIRLLTSVVAESSSLRRIKAEKALLTLADTYNLQGMDAGFLAYYELQAGRREASIENAWNAIRAAYHEERLLSPQQLDQLRSTLEGSSSENMRDRRDASMVGFLFAMNTIRRDPSASPDCAELADHPFDPLRATIGVRSKVLQREALQAALDKCTAEQREANSPRLSYLLGRVYSHDQNKTARQVLQKFLEAASDGDSYAYRGLAYTLEDLKCSGLSGALMDQSRFMTLNAHLATVEPLLAKFSGDREVWEWLKKLASTPPDQAGMLPPPGRPLDLDWIEQRCPAVQPR